MTEHHQDRVGNDEPGTAPGATFSVGSLVCHVIEDGGMDYSVDHLFPDAPEQERDAGLAGRLNARGELPLPYRCLLVETPSATVLIDTGLGPYAAMVHAPAGRLPDSLAAAGFATADIDIVVVTHAHPDHIGGLVDSGRLVFPDARHVMSALEWSTWTSADQLARLPEMLTIPARQVLPVVSRADALELVEGETEVVPGVRLVPAPGHTVGHCVVTLESGGQHALFAADAFLDPLQIARPEWTSVFDMLPEETTRTRTRLLDQAERDASLVLAFHLSGVGRVERRHKGYQLVR